MPTEWTDFLLATKVYHCTPSELDEQEDGVIEMHLAFIEVQGDMEHIEAMRQRQRERQKKQAGK